MYSVLIVDDEDPVLDSYAYMIENSGLELTVCGSARSGKEALQIARVSHPDIVIMDIAMPGLDGLSTVKELQKTLPESLYILSTAYERFDLAQRAIPLHVFEYLVKPVSRQRFTETLTEAIHRIEEKRSELLARVEAAGVAAETLEREEERFLLLASWKSLDAGTWERYRSLFDLSGDFARVCVIAVEHDPTVFTGVRSRVERKYRCIGAMYARYYLLFVPDAAEPDALRQTIVRAVEAETHSAQGVRIGIGSRCRYDELYRSADDAFLDAGLETDSDLYTTTDPLFRSLRNSLAHAHTVDEAYALFRESWVEIFGSRSFIDARAAMMAVVVLLLDDVTRDTGRDSLPTILSSLRQPLHEIGSVETMQEWEAWAGRFVRALIEYRKTVSAQNLPVPLENAVSYIHAHMAEPLQLSSIADHCGVSVGYLSRLFNEHLSSSFNDYLNTIRVEAAVQYLSERKYSIKEVAYMTGYHDPNYFSRIFRKIRGTSPSDFVTGRDES